MPSTCPRRPPARRIRGTVGVAAVLVSLAAAATAAAQPAATARDLTTRLVTAAAGHQAAAPDAGTRSSATLRAVAAQRRAILQQLVASDPGEVLRVALTPARRAALPADVRDLVEEHVTLEGTLEVYAEDYPRGHRIVRYLQTARDRLSLHFAGEAPGLLSGSRVRVRGVRVGDALALGGGTSKPGGGESLEPLAAALPDTFGEQRTLVILVNFRDKATEPYTTQHAWDVVFGATSAWDLEGSAGQTWLTGDVYGWFTIPLDSTVCDTSKLASYARQAAANAGAVLSQYRRLVYGFPANACSWWGLGTVGGSPSHAWVNGSFVLRVVAHEMGHNLGLYHAQSLDCGAEPIGASCTANTYGDTTDIMGASTGHFNAFQKDRLGWLDFGESPLIATVSSSGAYAIEPYAAPGAGPKALRILKDADANTWYYVEFRRAVGFDGFMGTGLTDGVVIHTGSAGDGNSSYLLDMTSTSSFADAALPAGRTFSDPAAGVSITPLSIDAAAALVDVSFGNTPCVAATPTVAISPAGTLWMTAGSPETLAVTVRNNDGPACAPAAFELTSVMPGGWSGELEASSATLAPGASATVALRVAAPTGTEPGFYDIAARAQHGDAPLAGEARVTAMVAGELSVSIGSSAASYRAREHVHLTALVRTGDSPVAGATVSFVIRKTNGSLVKGSAVTAEDGVANYSYRTKPKDPKGTYEATASASVDGTTAKAVTTFVLE